MAEYAVEAVGDCCSVGVEEVDEEDAAVVAARLAVTVMRSAYSVLFSADKKVGVLDVVLVTCVHSGLTSL